MLSMSVQLRFSKRARQWIKSLLHGLTFGGNFFALLLCGLLAVLKWRMSQKPKKQITNYNSGYEEDLSSGAEWLILNLNIAQTRFVPYLSDRLEGLLNVKRTNSTQVPKDYRRPHRWNQDLIARQSLKGYQDDLRSHSVWQASDSTCLQLSHQSSYQDCHLR